MINLKPGDIFCSFNSHNLFSKVLVAYQKFWAPDNEAKYSHSGIIINETGKTFEAHWKLSYMNLFKDHAGQDVLIGRYYDMNNFNYLKGYQKVQSLHGDWYPGYRLLFHLLPPIAKHVGLKSGKAVCSELSAKFLSGAGALKIWKGITPDYIADMINRWDDWEVIYKGKLPELEK